MAKIAEELGISELSARLDGPGRHRRRPSAWLDDDERAELVKLRREKRVLEMEIEILKRAAAYFARENILPK